MIGVQIDGVTAVISRDEIVIDGVVDVVLTALAHTMIRRGETVSLGISYPEVPAGFGSPYATAATIVEAARRAKLTGVVVVGVESDPGVVY